MFKRPLLPGLIWTGVIALLTFTPGNYIPRIISFSDWLSYDKLVHLFIFGVYGFFLIEGFNRQARHPRLSANPVLAGLLVGMVFAFFTEAMQKYVIHGRNGNIYDIMADMLGLTLGYLLWCIIGRNEKKNCLLLKNIINLAIRFKRPYLNTKKERHGSKKVTKS
ncbi:MAG: VanZ family protein [Bacteroidota bacterium]